MELFSKELLFPRKPQRASVCCLWLWDSEYTLLLDAVVHSYKTTQSY